MKSFFRFTAGEWAASALMGMLIIAGILFYFLYENSAVAHTDYTEYQEMFAQFEQEQQRLKDSVKAARTRDYRITRLQDEKDTRLQGYTDRSDWERINHYDKNKAFSDEISGSFLQDHR